ncbi:putative WD domain, G-beta repeat containing protein [Lyophyllum shimeji]|uniref:WD domain, G-beta repeat containing protein n=1 Tax=Lyophyllum shimeji TaxID=47721 RepID=A0A9P3PCX6_LYOSH|nr:putative WD domain, G-beta repeat containing protein [Lyophyllum shimeji]
MLPSPASSPQHVLYNRTNVLSTPIQTKLSFALPTPPEDGKHRKRLNATSAQTVLKKRKLSFVDDGDAFSDDDQSGADSDVEMEDIGVLQARSQRYTPFHTRMRAVMQVPGRGRREEPSTRAILQSFVSSHKSDLFKCQSNDVNAYLTPPYACSYTQSAKRGGLPILAVATEQGTVHLVDTSKRKDWDPEPPCTTLQIHDNGIFDAKWNADDTLLATCSGDKSTHITCARTQIVTHSLRGHESTVKCVTWDPTHKELLSSGGRNGSICIWDLRVPGVKEADEAGPSVLSPVISIAGAHEDAKFKRGRRGKNVPTPRSITSLLYPETGPYGLISSGSFDGILKYWDLRLPTNTRKSKSTKPQPPANLYSSPIDPTTLNGSHRPRGIVRLCAGTGPTAGLVFGLGADCRIHTYSVPNLEALPTGYSHDKMQKNSFYVGLSLSPCGRWLAAGSGGSGTDTHGSAFLFDVDNASRPWMPRRDGVQLQSQQGEVGAIDWAEGMLATCADDGTVRVWRPDIETYRTCVERPEESRWDWSWAA